jgi:O-antigen/teichoic acid export membrane protein
MKILNQMQQDIVWRTLQIGAKQGALFMIFFIAAKHLTAIEFGIYNYLLAISFLLVIFSDFGISVSSARYVARYGVLDKAKQQMILFNVALLILALGLIVSALSLLYIFFLSPPYGHFLKYILPLVFLIPLTSVYDGLYRGLRRFKRVSIITITVSVASILGTNILTNILGLAGALLSVNIFYCLLLLGNMFCYGKSVKKIDFLIMKEVGYYASSVGVIWAAYFLYSRADLLILGHFGFIVEIGYYELANKVIMLMLLPVAVVSQVESPNIVALHAENALKSIHKRLFVSYKVLALFTVVSTVLAAVAVPFIIKYTLPQFLTPLVLTIIFASLIFYPFQAFSEYIGNTFIVSTGHASLNMKNVIFFGIINILLDFIFIKHSGAIGVLYSRTFSVVIGSLTLIFLYHLKLVRDGAASHR